MFLGPDEKSSSLLCFQVVLNPMLYEFSSTTERVMRDRSQAKGNYLHRRYSISNFFFCHLSANLFSDKRGRCLTSLTLPLDIHTLPTHFSLPARGLGLFECEKKYVSNLLTLARYGCRKISCFCFQVTGSVGWPNLCPNNFESFLISSHYTHSRTCSR